MARTAVKIDCTECDQTGYENFYTVTEIQGYYRPGGYKRWNVVEGQLSYHGDAGVKVSDQYETLLQDAKFIEFNGAKWNFNVMRDPGRTFGQRRLQLAVTRKE